MTNWVLALVACGMVVVPLSAPLATPLDKAACDELQNEQSRLKAAGVAADRDRGADWGKNQLPAERIREIGRLIDVDADLAFRCGRGPRPALKTAVAKPVDVPLSPRPAAPAVPADSDDEAATGTVAPDTGPASRPAAKPGHTGLPSSLKQITDDAEKPARAGSAASPAPESNARRPASKKRSQAAAPGVQ